MSDHGKQPGDDPRPRKELSTNEYQRRLLNKLNCLIAVLEVAIGKLTQTVDGDASKAERLGKIRNNLENTLGICRRAKRTLETKILGDDDEEPKQLPSSPTAEADAPARASRLSFRNYVELSSIDEFRKFKKLDPISTEDVSDVDLDDLARQLGEL